MKKIQRYGLFLAAGLFLSACGGTGERSDTAPKASDGYSKAVTFTKIKVFGDSLSDSGVYENLSAYGYGRVFSVNGDNTKIWSEVIAAKYKLTAPCNYYTFNGATYTVGESTCTSYAVGGARLVNQDTKTTPSGIPKQMVDAAEVGGYSETDLVLVAGGGNDYADLITKFLAISSAANADKPAKIGEYETLTGLTVAQGTALYNKSSSPSVASFTTATSTQQTAILVGMGIANMTTLAGKYFDMVKTNIVDKGATHVVMLNMPSVVDTPRLQEVLTLVSAKTKQGNMTAGKTEAEATAIAQATVAQLDSVFRIWGNTFNTELSKKIKADGGGKIALVDFYTNMLNMVAYPTKFGLTNVKDTACTSTSTNATTGLKEYTFSTCTETALSQTPPTGTSGENWWKNYLYSDSFHPTPYGHSLMASIVMTQMTSVGW